MEMETKTDIDYQCGKCHAKQQQYVRHTPYDSPIPRFICHPNETVLQVLNQNQKQSTMEIETNKLCVMIQSSLSSETDKQRAKQHDAQYHYSHKHH